MNTLNAKSNGLRCFVREQVESKSSSEMLKSISHLLITLISVNLAFAQSNRVGIAPSVPLKNCQVDQWTGENGLVSNNLTSVIQSKEGFLWITTNNGIMRFDGNQLEVFDKIAIPLFATDGFVKSYESNGKLYFSTRGNGIVTFQDGSFDQLLQSDTLLPKSTRSMLFSQSGKIYIGTDTKGVFVIENDQVNTLKGLPFIDAMIMAIAEAPDGSIWIATEGKGLFHYKTDQTFKQYTTDNDLLGNAVGALKVLRDGRVLVGTNQGVNEIENGKVSSWDFLKGIRVSSIITDRFESIWLGTELGIARINENLQTEEFLHNDDKFPGSHITSMVFDEEGSIWLSTSKSGLLRLRDTNILNFSTTQGLSINRVNIISEGPEGSFFVGQDEGHINKISQEQVNDLQLSKVPNTSIRDIAFDRDGAMWIATYSGLFKKTSKGETKHFDPAYVGNDFRRILFDSKGYMWLATKTGGAIQLKDEKIIKIWNRSEGLASDYILSIEEGPNGFIYFGTHSGGLSVLDPQMNKVTTYQALEDDAGVLIFNVDIDQQGKVWIVANIGLFHFDGQKIVPIYLDEVSKGESFFDWVEDDRGNVWVSSNIGVVQFKKQHLLNFIAGKRVNIKRRLFDQDYGMRNKECTGATRSLKASDGRIWIPTLDGVCIIDPNKSTENPHVPPIYITQFYVDQGNVLNWDNDQSYKIQPGNLRYTFNFTALSLLAPRKVKFKYKLENFDKDWIEAEERSASYTNLPPGKYSFTVIACNNDGVWNEVGDTINIEVLPEFYQTVQFYVLLVLVTLVALFGAYQWRVYGIKRRNIVLTKVNSELDRFVYSASHDLRAPLASILGLINVARIDDSPTNRAEYYNLIEKSVKKLDSFINDIIEFSRNSRLKISSDVINFEELVNGLIDELRFLDEKNQIRRIVKVNGFGEFKTDQKRLTIVLNNLISNAIKYHNLTKEDPFIEVDVEYNDQVARISVKDNGIGIPKEHLEHIFKMFYRATDSSKGSGLGLYIVIEALEKINGKVTVESEYHVGSTFHVELRSNANDNEKKKASWLTKLKSTN